MKPLADLLQNACVHHQRLCPRQVLGVRIGRLAGALLSLDLPQADKRLLAICETDGCFVDGISAATGCYVGRRTLRVVDFGKTAAVFVDTVNERAVRITPQADVRTLAWRYAPDAGSRWEAQLLGYQRLPDEDLLRTVWVTLHARVSALVGQPGSRVQCDVCGEEIINQREVLWPAHVLCRSCAGEVYYRPVQTWSLARS